MLKKVILTMLSTSALLVAQTDVLVGLYSGVAFNNTTIKAESTSAAINGTEISRDKSSALYGVKFGRANRNAQYYLSYDQAGKTDDILLRRMMVNLDFLPNLSDDGKFKSLAGVGVGYTQSEYDVISTKTSKEQSGIIALRCGLAYEVFENSDIELVYEYGWIVNGGKATTTYWVGNDAVRHKIISQNNSMLRIGYNYRF
jgi:hypothetical protein